MRALFISLGLAIVLGWLGFEMRTNYRTLSTVLYTLSAMLVALGIVAFFGLN
jgi:hypothetical protein